MKKICVLLLALIAVLGLGGCAADTAAYTEYRGVQIPNSDIELLQKYCEAEDIAFTDSLLESLAYQQVQLDEAERLGLTADWQEVEEYYQQMLAQYMPALASDDEFARQSVVEFLLQMQAQQEYLGMNNAEYNEYLISQWQDMFTISALEQHFMEQLTMPLTESPDALYEEYVEGLMQAAESGQGA